MADSLAREAQPLHERLAMKRKSMAEQRKEYARLKGREDELSRQITRLAAQVRFGKDGFEGWSAQVREQGMMADSLARERSNLESELQVYQTTFKRFASLLEEARIARQQAAGDIQIVSRAVVARPVPRGTVKKATIAGIVGLMASVMLAFLLEYVGRAREGEARPPAPTPGG